MSNTYCSKLDCGKLSCEYHQYNAPKRCDISIADRDTGCWGLAENHDKFYYCGLSDCRKKMCMFHLDRAPVGVVVEVKNQDSCLECYEAPYEKRKALMAAICRGTQKTNYKCDDTCKALCGNDGTCAYCSIIADAIEEEFGK